MKTFLTHLFAVAVGVMAALQLRPASNDREPLSGETQKSERIKRDMASSFTPPRAGFASRMDRPQVGEELSGEISASDLEQWVAGRKGDSRSLAEAQAIAGLLANNPDLIRQAIETDPESPHLLYIGATLSSFPQEERLALSERFYQQDTKNKLSAYIYAAQLFEAGDTSEAIKILKSSADRPRIDTFAAQTQLLMDDAYVAAGYSPDSAKLLSVSNLQLPYGSDLLTFAGSLNDAGDSLPAEEATELRTLSASMAMRLADQKSSGTFINHLIGLSIEEKTLASLANNSPSPYEGLTVGQARQAITKEREELRKVMEQAPGLDVIISGDPEFAGRYIDRFRLVGEQEATRWWLSTTSGQRWLAIPKEPNKPEVATPRKPSD